MYNTFNRIFSSWSGNSKGDKLIPLWLNAWLMRGQADERKNISKRKEGCGHWGLFKSVGRKWTTFSLQTNFPRPKKLIGMFISADICCSYQTLRIHQENLNLRQTVKDRTHKESFIYRSWKKKKLCTRLALKTGVEIFWSIINDSRAYFFFDWGSILHESWKGCISEKIYLCDQKDLECEIWEKICSIKNKEVKCPDMKQWLRHNKARVLQVHLVS